jgi:hypothetical protein
MWTSWVGSVRVDRQGNTLFVGNQSWRRGRYEGNFQVAGPALRTPAMNTIIGFDYPRALSPPVTIAHEVWESTSPSRTCIYTYIHTHTHRHYIILLHVYTANSITEYSFFFSFFLFFLFWTFLSRFNSFLLFGCCHCPQTRRDNDSICDKNNIKKSRSKKRKKKKKKKSCNQPRRRLIFHLALWCAGLKRQESLRRIIAYYAQLSHKVPSRKSGITTCDKRVTRESDTQKREKKRKRKECERDRAKSVNRCLRSPPRSRKSIGKFGMQGCFGRWTKQPTRVDGGCEKLKKQKEQNNTRAVCESMREKGMAKKKTKGGGGELRARERWRRWWRWKCGRCSAIGWRWGGKGVGLVFYGKYRWWKQKEEKRARDLCISRVPEREIPGRISALDDSTVFIADA